MSKKGGSDAKPLAFLWTVPLAVDDIPDAGLHREINASAAVCADVAALAHVREVSNLSAAFDLTCQGARVHVTGRVKARVGQNCVVTLEPVDAAVEEPIEVTFAPMPAAGATPKSEERRRKAAEEPPEPLIDGTVDLGAIATEFLMLGIDPYPRKAGIEFTPPKVENDTPHPFAALEVLKNGPSRGRQ